MAKLRDSKLRETTGAYERLFGIPALGLLISRVQSTVISSGNELEGIILEKAHNPIEDLDVFLNDEIMKNGIFLAPKKEIKKCQTLHFPEGDPDFLVFKRKNSESRCYVVEVKDGFSFDTKKASAELSNMRSFVEQNRQNLNCNEISFHFVGFNKDDRESIVKGFKNKITLEEAMTGREFCNLIKLDYDAITKARKGDQPDNVDYFLKELTQIAPVREKLRKILKHSDD